MIRPLPLLYSVARAIHKTLLVLQNVFILATPSTRSSLSPPQRTVAPTTTAYTAIITMSLTTVVLWLIPAPVTTLGMKIHPVPIDN